MFSLGKKSVLAFGMAMVALFGTETPANADTASFINSVGPAAQQIHKEFNIPASVTIGQAANESRWGESKLSVEDKNYFGFKCIPKDKPGPYATGCRYRTNSAGQDGAYYRVYSSMTDSFRDYARLVTSPTYAKAQPYRNNPDEFIRHLSPPYSTTRDYAERIIRIMKQHNLYRFDK